MNSDSATDPKLTARKVAMGLLARREHCCSELVFKLQARGYSSIDARAVVDQLNEQGLQSDHRYAESLVAVRCGRGYGPDRVRAELRAKSVPTDIIDAVVIEAGQGWQDAAQRALIRKYPAASALGGHDWLVAKQYLRKRGFTGHQAELALSNVRQDPPG